MRIDGDGKAIYELTILLTPKEAQDVTAVLNQLLSIVPSEKPISENEVDDAPSEYEAGNRLIRLVLYADAEAERQHDAEFSAP